MAHVTETCNNQTTEIITDYEVMHAGKSDRGKDMGVIDRLSKNNKQPEKLYEDGGYPTGQGLLKAQEKGVKIIAPMPIGNFAKDAICRDQFKFDDKSGQCTACPAGHAPIGHGMRTYGRNKTPTFHAFFYGRKCRQCSLVKRCITRPPNNGSKGNFRLEIEPHLIAKDRALAEQNKDEWWDDYAIRAGIEASISELKRAHGLGKLKVRRITRVRLAVGLKVTACNVKRWIKASTNAPSVPANPGPNFSKAFFALYFPSYWLVSLFDGDREYNLLFEDNL